MKQLKIRGKLIPNEQQLTVKQLRKWLKQNCTGHELVEKKADIPCETCWTTERRQVLEHGLYEKITQNHLDNVNDVLRIH